eukprot:TRINITY_DN2095_c0_g1_i2.p1 TRINITY_DN2095_c0_g1~~TRINITY_DN2095_c0_g1_i2.p1  ORF type:complete len:737 (-),score=186.41 TRINITY_DN2095_c0_g1_i2:193-2403(-)
MLVLWATTTTSRTAPPHLFPLPTPSPSPSPSLCVCVCNSATTDKLQVSSSYRGARIPDPPTLDSVLDMMEKLKQGVLIHYRYAKLILEKARALLFSADTLTELEIQGEEKMTIVGDTHGQLDDLFSIFHLNGIPSPENRYVVNGDFVDRGEHGCEVVLMLLAFKILYPNAVHMNRGNHETLTMNCTYNFREEVREKYDDEMFDLFQEVFCLLPLATTVQRRVLVLHGGLFKHEGVKLEHLRQIRRNMQPPVKPRTFEESLIEDILWSDPQDEPGRVPNVARGSGVSFGPDVTAAFLAENRLDMLIRSHECKDAGFEINHNGQLMTIFSASNYCGDTWNKGAYVVFKKDMKARVQQFMASSLELIPPPQQRIEQLTRDTIQKIIDRICEHRLDLLWYYTQLDANKTGRLTVEQWAQGLKNVLKLNLKWPKLVSKLATVESDNSINFTKFLDRYKIDITDQDAKNFQNNIITKIKEKIFAKCESINDAFRVFDSDHDGQISWQELLSALRKLDTGLSDEQIYEFMRSVDSNNDNQISLDEFTSRFKIIYHGNNTDTWASETIREICETIYKANSSPREAFLNFDINGDGVVTHQEFVKALQNYNFHFTPAEYERLLKFVDADRSGEVEYEEFLAAFDIADSAGSEWSENVVQQICSVLYSNREQLRRVFAGLDPENTGVITVAEFRTGIESLNLLLAKPLSDLDVGELVKAFATSNAKVRYRAFLNSFAVIDTNMRTN